MLASVFHLLANAQGGPSDADLLDKNPCLPEHCQSTTDAWYGGREAGYCPLGVHVLLEVLCTQIFGTPILGICGEDWGSEVV
jgi:hypothetical protein